MHQKTKKSWSGQRLNMLVFGTLGFAMLGWFAYVFVFHDNQNPKASKEEQINLPFDTVRPQEVIASRMEKKTEILGKQMHFMKQAILEDKSRSIEEKEESILLANEMENLKKEISILKKNQVNTFVDPQNITRCSEEDQEKLFLRPALIEVGSIDPKKKVMSIENTIPMGTTARAILISSVDADCTTFSTSEPQPIKLRILDNGHCPKGNNVPLKGGVIIGSAYGKSFFGKSYYSH